MDYQGRRIDTGEPVEIEVQDGVITAIHKLTEDPGHLPWVSSGWIDLQVNGLAGYDLNSERVTSADIEGVTRALHARGVAAYLPTVITGSDDRIKQGLRALADYCNSGAYGASSIIGLHLEGPYLSSEDGCRGAHDRAYTRNPDWEEFQRFQEAADGRIIMVTLAPERPGSLPFIEKLAEAGVVVAIGHTMATGEQLDAAIRAGATLSTHLGNGSQPHLPRHPNYIWDQLADDRLWATFIPDGHHLAPHVLKAMQRIKREKTILVSDCVKFGGMPPGRYHSLIGSHVELEANGRLSMVEHPAILAGSASTLDMGIAGAVAYTDMSLAEAIEAVTIRPAQVLGRPLLGMLETGAQASFTPFTWEEASASIRVVDTITDGMSRFGPR
ncbi:N-acetylglucosamine-6-phosphate deacetylase [Paenibacillus daejeonensis]|uniref:N-acetylglucosamine-6-phosphate deacetylase n=1 Tax=Paenibacillus daejeonensis TaxID=135193 RepID=UPI00036C9BF9|nr:amidohydrolase family protein [Paenibacillus daejeonensis]